MDFLELFLPPKSGGDRIRNLSRQISGATRGKAPALLKQTRDEVGFLALALLTLETLLVEKGIVTQGEFNARLQKLDELDGLRDEKLDAATLRRALALRPAGAAAAKGPGKAPPRARIVRRPKASQPGRADAAAKDRKTSKTASFSSAAGKVKTRTAKSEAAKKPQGDSDAPATTDLDTSSLGKISYEAYFGESGQKK